MSQPTGTYAGYGAYGSYANTAAPAAAGTYGGIYNNYSSAPAPAPAPAPATGSQQPPAWSSQPYSTAQPQQQQQQQQQAPPLPGSSTQHSSGMYSGGQYQQQHQQQYQQPQQQAPQQQYQQPQQQAPQQQYQQQHQQYQPQQQQQQQQQQASQGYEDYAPRQSASRNPPGGSPMTDTFSPRVPYESEPLIDPSRHPRPVPTRKVDVTSAPNPPKVLPYGRIPKEVMNSTVGSWATDGNRSSTSAPSSSVGFIGIDDGNANAKFIRMTAGMPFSSDAQVKDSALPFGAVLAPLCRPLHEKEEIPVVRGRAPVRCHRCRAYMSCHARFTDGGRRWGCPLCEMTNDVEDAYFANLDTKGRRVDRLEKPELCLGSVEYVVDQFPEYNLRNEKDEVLPTRPLHHLFLVDLSLHALGTYLPSYVNALEEAITHMASNTPQCRVSFVTYASQLHFYNLQDPSMPQFCVPDVENPFVPLPHSLLGWLEAGRDLERIKAFLQRLPTIAKDLNESGCALGAAVQVALLVLAGQHGGRVVMCGHRCPNIGVGAIAPRAQHLLYGTPKEKELFRPIDGFWTTKALEAAKQQVSFDLFMFCPEYCELVTLSHMSHMTNGQVFLFQHFDAALDYHKLAALMRRLATEEAGYAGILRVRCSTGLRVKRYRGHFLSQTAHDMDLASVSGSSTFFVEFAHESTLEKNSYAYFQVALLYTTRSGSRRVRVHNLRTLVAAHLPAAFGGSDLEAVLFGYIQESMSEALNKGTKAGRQLLQDRVAAMLIGYRRFVSFQEKRKALLMPSRLHLMVLYSLCLVKSDALVDGTSTLIDTRISNMYNLMSMPLHQLLDYLYPALYPLHGMRQDKACGTINEITGQCNLPPRSQLLYDSITVDGVYVLCDEEAHLVYLWIGSDVDPEVSEELFGTPNARSVCCDGGVTTDNFSEKVRNILYALAFKEDVMRRLVVLHQGDAGEFAFFKNMKEEQHSATGPAHDAWLQHFYGEVIKALQ